MKSRTAGGMAWLVAAAACAANPRSHLTAPTGLEATETYLCAVAAVNRLGYRVESGDRAAGRVVARSVRERGYAPTGERRYDEIVVSLVHEPQGSQLHVIATDRGHAQAVLDGCSGFKAPSSPN